MLPSEELNFFPQKQKAAEQRLGEQQRQVSGEVATVKTEGP